MTTTISNKELLSQYAKAHNELLLRKILKQGGMTSVKVVALLRFNGCEVYLTDRADATSSTFSASAGTHVRFCFVHLNVERLEWEASYQGLSFEEVFTASLFHEAGHVCNFKSILGFEAPGWDEVAAWTTGFSLYRDCSGKHEIPSSWKAIAKSCLASYGINTNSVSAVVEYRSQQTIDAGVRNRELARRAFWQAADN